MDWNKFILGSESNKIQVIKAVREEYDLGLKDAKLLVDFAYDEKNKDPNVDLNQLVKKLAIKQETAQKRKTPTASTKNNQQNLFGEGTIQSVWNSNMTKVLKYQQELWHAGLNEHTVVSSPDENILKNKVKAQNDKWNDKWIKVEEKRILEETKNSKIKKASSLTKEAEDNILEIQQLLPDLMKNYSAFKLDSLKDYSKYEEAYPKKPTEPIYKTIPTLPNKNGLEFRPKLDFFSSIIGSLKRKAISKAENLYNVKLLEWENKKDSINNDNRELKSYYQNDIVKYEDKVKVWEKNKNIYDEERNNFNKRIDEWKMRFEKQEPLAIVEYFESALNKSKIPAFVTKEFEIEYNPLNEIMIVDYKLPNNSDIPSLKEVKYIATRDEMKETYYSDSFLEKLYDTTIYSIILKTIYEIIESDYIAVVGTVSFNGWLHHLNKSNGIYEDICITSIQVTRDEFKDIDLSRVEAKACFKSLKGISAPNLSGITPVQPILVMNKVDKRFVSSYDVTNSLDDTTNLAAISWEDFEHLIRELFQEEFSSTGGEVKVTQASRDGGVDAIAFDPDPIRGGKIAIQAKRYTNIVGVAAVRDLYGTVINEGASRGILVTTSDYGADSHKFAKDKPITLLNGANLLSLLEKHGHRAKIDLQEAKILNKQEYSSNSFN